MVFYFWRFNYTKKQADAQYLLVKNIRFFLFSGYLNETAPLWSKRQDSNLRSPVPETGAIPPSLRLEIGKLKVNFVVARYVASLKNMG